jgi:hypothetical protein
MAEAKTGTTEKVVVKMVETTESIPVINLTLTPGEAQVLYGVLSRVGGHEKGFRGVVDDIYNSLTNLTPELEYGTSSYNTISRSLEGHLVFQE